MKWAFSTRLSLLGLAVLILAACGTASTPQPVGPATTAASTAPPASPTLAAATNTPAAQAAATAIVSPTATAVLTATSRAAPTAAPSAATAVTRTAAATAVVTATRAITAMRAITATVVATATKIVEPPNLAAVPNVEIFASGLDTPWAIAFAPDGRIFISERPGRIRVIKDGKLDAEPWMTLDVNEAGEAGLLGLALDPQFAQNRYVYVAYTDNSPEGGLRNRLVRLREDPATGKGVMDKVLIDNVPANTNHDGGRVKFGPDGKLYWTMGEAQNMARGPRSENAQRQNPPHQPRRQYPKRQSDPRIADLLLRPPQSAGTGVAAGDETPLCDRARSQRRKGLLPG